MSGVKILLRELPERIDRTGVMINIKDPDVATKPASHLIHYVRVDLSARDINSPVPGRYADAPVASFVPGPSLSLSGTWATVAADPYYTAVDPGGQYLFVGNTIPDSTVTPRGISVFKIDSDYHLTEIQGSPFDADSGPQSACVSVHPNGQVVYAANLSWGEANSGIYAYGIDSSGALSPLGSVAAGQNCYYVQVSPDGSYVFALFGDGEQAKGGYAAFSINSDGSIGNKLQEYIWPWAPREASALSSDGAFLYLSDSSTGGIHAFSRSDTGALNEISGSPFAADPNYGALIQLNGYLYSGRDAGGWQIYSIGSDGGLSLITDNPVFSGSVYLHPVADPQNNRILAISISESALHVFYADRSGMLTEAFESPVDTGDGPTSLALTPDLLIAYVPSNNGGGINGYFAQPADPIIIAQDHITAYVGADVTVFIDAVGLQPVDFSVDALPAGLHLTNEGISGVLERTVTIYGPSTVDVYAGGSVSIQINAIYGAAPYTWAADQLPPGLVLSPDGDSVVISGVVS